MANVLVRAMQRLGGYGWFASGAAWWAPRADLWLHRRTGGKRTFLTVLFPVGVLTTTGRRSGLPRRSPLLVLPDPDSPGHLVIGSNFGLSRTPAWALNLAADPHATLDRRGVPVAVTAELLEGPDRARAWQHLCAAWPAYRAYAARAPRDFPLFRLAPADPTAPGRPTGGAAEPEVPGSGQE